MSSTALPTYQQFVSEGLNKIAPADAAEEQCRICCEELSETEGEIIVKTPCGHEFHENCLKTWMTGEVESRCKCPFCRTALFRDSPIELGVRQLRAAAQIPIPDNHVERHLPGNAEYLTYLNRNRDVAEDIIFEDREAIVAAAELAWNIRWEMIPELGEPAPIDIDFVAIVIRNATYHYSRTASQENRLAAYSFRELVFWLIVDWIVENCDEEIILSAGGRMYVIVSGYRDYLFDRVEELENHREVE